MDNKNSIDFRRTNRRYASVFKEFCARLGSILDPADQTGFVEASRSGNVDAIRFSPDTVTCPDSYRSGYLLREVIRKYQSFPGDASARKEKALSSFRKAEEQCARTNSRLNGSCSQYVFKGVTGAALLHTMRRKIEHLLGDFDLDEAASGFGFGPGASTRLRRTRADAWYKFQGIPETTWNNATFAAAIMARWDLWKQFQGPLLDEEPAGFKIVGANRVVTVPKSAKTDRVIAIEPDLNMFVQQGIGKMIRRRLKRASIDLNDQTINQRLASVGSSNGSLATIDLSMASDTVAKALVELLMPPSWLRHMDMCRSPNGLLPDGSVCHYRKYSSMGNAYTFELESLIFWALCSSVYDLIGSSGSILSVFGDDLIVDSQAYPYVSAALDFLGFSVNTEKSFSDGGFRESCGKHYFRGVDVSPFYVRDDIRSHADVILLANNIVRWSARGSFRDATLLPVYNWLVSLLPRRLQKVSIPDGVGDGALIGDFDEISPQTAKRGHKYFSFEGYLCRTIVPYFHRRGVGGTGSLLKSLFSLEKARQEDLQPLVHHLWRPRTSREGLWHFHGDVLSGVPHSADLPSGWERHKFCDILVWRFPQLGPWF